MTVYNFRGKLAETENRISSMALVQEKFYKSENLSKLSAKTYMQELTSNILDTFEPDIPVHINYDIESIQYNIDKLIPMGLIINEVISNSIKYAFTGRNQGEISLKLKYDSINKITSFQLSDNGMGADLSFKELSKDSLGIELIKSLCEQLDGEVKLLTNTGFDYFFTFPELK
jgi:two-component sensor histidine kinase